MSVIMVKWFVSHSQRSFCVCYYGEMVRHSQPTIVLCLLLWPNGSSVTANNCSVYYYGQMVRYSQPTIVLSIIMAKWFVTHSQQQFCVHYYGQVVRQSQPTIGHAPMVRQSQPTIVVCLLLWPNGSSLTASNCSVSIIMAKWFVSRSQQ